MRSLIFFMIVFICYGNKASCQQNDSPNIYLVSLTSHLGYLKSVNKKSIQVYVEKSDITETLPDQIDGTRIVYLTKSEIRDKTRKGQRIDLIVMRPVIVGVKSLQVTIIDFSVTSKKNMFNYANGGGSTLEFAYNCNLGRFELTNKRQGGI